MTGKDVPMSDTRNDLPLGFSAGAAAAGFKKAGRDDLGLIVSDRPAVLAGLFTTNAFKAAPVQVCQQTLREYGTCRAVLANSGQANACTGDEGLENCLETRRMVAALTGLAPHEIMPMSTGVIGDQLKMDRWREAVPSLVESLGSRDAEGFTRAFMTTDAFPKFASITVPLSGGTVRLTGMAKGAGMICPNMATMLAVMLTDADVDRETWQAMFARAVDKTFNRVSVDGDTSTNDTILGLANGASGIRAEGEDAALLEKGLTDILGQISYMLVKDGEGASKVMHITVSGAASDEDACRIARTVGHSQLVKTAIYARTPTGAASWPLWAAAGPRWTPAACAWCSAASSVSATASPSTATRKPSFPSCSRPPTSRWRSIWVWATAATICAPPTSATNTSASTPITARKRESFFMRGEGGPLLAPKGPPSPLKLPPSSPNALYQREAEKHGIAVLPRLSFFVTDISPAIPAALPQLPPRQSGLPYKRSSYTARQQPPVFPASDILTFPHLLPLC